MKRKKKPRLTPAQRKKVRALVAKRKKLNQQIDLTDFKIHEIAFATSDWKTAVAGCPPRR